MGTNMKKIGIFGSAFGPPTLGHKDLIEQAKVSLDEIWLIPSFAHGFGKKMFPYEFRMALTKAFAYDLNIDGVLAKDIEGSMEQVITGEPIYTYDLLCFIHNTLKKAPLDEDFELHFIMGPDNAEAWKKFYKSEEIEKHWNLFIGKETKSIRSTVVRNRIASNEPITDLVTPSVEKLMAEAPKEVLELIRQQAEQK